MRSSLIEWTIIILISAGNLGTVIAQTSRKCTIKELVGTVKIRRGNSTAWSDARPEMPLKESDAIRTYLESEAKIETSEGSSIKIGENTTVELKALQGTANEQNTSVKIMSGAILANVKKFVSTGSSFEFETPTATAAIRGTIVGLEVSKEQTRVKVYEGKVLVTPQGSKNGIEIQQYQMGVVQKGKEKVALQKFDEKSPVPLSVKNSAANDSLKTTRDSTNSTADSTHGIDTGRTIDTSGHSSRSAQQNSSLFVTLSSPAEGVLIAPTATIPVTGMVQPSGASVMVNGKSVAVAADGIFKTMLAVPGKSGDLEIGITAEYQGAVKMVSRRVLVKTSQLIFALSVPLDGQEFSKPLIPVSGTASAGAEVTVLSMKLPVSASGSFSGQVPIANEAGDLTLEFEASLDGVTQKITRRVVYKPEYRFIVTTPSDYQTVSTTNIIIKGEVLPATAEVSVMGKRLSVTTGGQFSGYVTIPDEEGEVILDFEIITGGLSKSEMRKIVYKRPPDTYRPQLSASIAKGCWNITVFDRTVDEEITLWQEIDGDKEFKTMRPNESVCIPFENGIHSYRVYAEDKGKNKSTVELLQNYPFLSNTTWLIRMRKPAGNISIDIPPSSPDGEPSLYPVEFTIENLPQDNMKLIREVSVTNKTNGKRVTIRTFTDNFIETDVELVRQRINQVQIEVNDINNVIKNQTFQINAR